jgi:hypothetical protein
LGEWRYSTTHSLTSALDRGEWSASRPGRFTPRERVPGTHWIGGWVGCRDFLDAVVKRKIPSPHRKLNPGTPIIQPVANVSYKLPIITDLYARTPRHEGVLEEWRYSSTHSLTSALDGGEWSALRPGHFTPRERSPGTHWIGGWVSPRAVLDAVMKRRIPSPSRESKPKSPLVQLVDQSLYVLSYHIKKAQRHLYLYFTFTCKMKFSR